VSFRYEHWASASNLVRKPCPVFVVEGRRTVVLGEGKRWRDLKRAVVGVAFDGDVELVDATCESASGVPDRTTSPFSSTACIPLSSDRGVSCGSPVTTLQMPCEHW
jgi:hypothetical protein